MPTLEQQTSAARARLAQREAELAYADQKYREALIAAADDAGPADRAASDKQIAVKATRLEDAQKAVKLERDRLDALAIAIETEKRQAAELLAEAKRASLTEALGRLDKKAAQVAAAIRTAGDEFAELISIARELVISDGEGGPANVNNTLEPILTGMTIDLIRNGLGARFPNAADVLLRRNERVDYGLIGAAQVVRYRATGEPVDGDTAEAA